MIDRRLPFLCLTLAVIASVTTSGAFGQQPSASSAYESAAPATGQPAGPPPGAVNPTALGQAGAPAPQTPPLPPGFPLSAVEQQFVLQTLQMWETKSKDVKTFNSEFELLHYDAVFGGQLDRPIIQSTGTLSYSKPDKGSFKIDAISRWVKKNPQDNAANAEGEFVPQPHEIGEHWVCDGKAIYEYNHRDKQLVVTGIPEEMRGAGIVDGPLPFLFGAEANKLMTRYWIRSKESTPDRIWLEAYPRWQSDAANYESVEVMIDRKTMQPTAIQVHLPGGQQLDTYMFKDPSINAPNLGSWFGGLFSQPRTPLGWTRVKAEDRAGPQAANPQDGVQR